MAMRNKGSDLEILRQIITYCNDCQELCNEINNDYDKFVNTKVFYFGISMLVFQIGEYTFNGFSKNFRERYPDFPWNEIREMRNDFGHAYGNMNAMNIWESATQKAPHIREFCEGILKDFYNSFPN
jgi:uncharacterized protein with HEPN domain